MSESFDSTAAVAAHYAALYAQHGDTTRALDWKNAHSQLVCFLQMAGCDGLESGVSVLDVGCGLGHFKEFLDLRGLTVEYTGWDICEPLIDRARELHPDARFACRDILAAGSDSDAGGDGGTGDDSFDFVMCSAALNMRIPDHEKWTLAMLRAMYQRCRRALVFNMLSARYAAAHPLTTNHTRYYYAPPEAVLGSCLGLSPHVVLQHGELPNIFTVYVYRPSARPVERTMSALNLGRKFGPQHEKVVQHFASLGLHRELITWLESMEPSAEVCDHIGIHWLHLGDPRRSLEAFSRAVELDSQALRPLRHLALMHLDAGRYAQACPLLERASALAPGDPEVAYRLARAYELAGRQADAHTAYAAVLELAPQHESARAGLSRCAGQESEVPSQQ